MKSAAKPAIAPGMGPNRSPAMNSGTASMEKRVSSFGMSDMSRDSTTLSAVSSAHPASTRTDMACLGLLDIKNTS